MCEGKEGFKRDGITYTCCYDHYYNGSTCVRCLPGLYGTDCLKTCDIGFYGEQCSKRCLCNKKFCHHKHGCIFEYSGSSEIPHIGYTYESSITNHTLAKSNSPLPPLTSTSHTTDIRFPLQTNIFIFAIGSVMTLFLGIIVVQFCFKLRIKRTKYTQQMSVQQNPVNEEETYHEIIEALVSIEGDNSRNEQRHAGKYDELQATNQLTGVPYDKIKTKSQYQAINDSQVELSCNSDSSNSSSTSYLSPKTNENLNYIGVMESSTARNEIRIKESNVDSTNDSSKVSSQYLDPIHIIHNDEIVLQSHENTDNNGAYLDVIHDTFV